MAQQAYEIVLDVWGQSVKKQTIANRSSKWKQYLLKHNLVALSKQKLAEIKLEAFPSVSKEHYFKT